MANDTVAVTSDERVPIVPGEMLLTVPEIFTVTLMDEHIVGPEVGKLTASAMVVMGQDNEYSGSTTVVLPKDEFGTGLHSTALQQIESTAKADSQITTNDYLESVATRRRNSAITAAVGSAMVTSSVLLLALHEEGNSSNVQTGIVALFLGGATVLAASILGPNSSHPRARQRRELEKVTKQHRRHEVLAFIGRYAQKQQEPTSAE